MTITSTVNLGNQYNQATPLVPASAPASSGGLSFGDILDTINPLQHIPVLSGVYRSLTGSAISDTAKIAGDTLYGFALGGGAVISAVAGAASSTADVAVANISGSDISSHIVNAISSVSPTNNTGFQLVPAAMTAENIQPVAMNTFDKNPASTAAHYRHAQILDTVNRNLLKMAV